MQEIYLIDEMSFSNIVTIISEVERSKAKDFRLYLETDGGNAYASLFFRNWLKKIEKIKEIICVGDVISGGVLLLCGQYHIKKIAYPYITFGIHGIMLHHNEEIISYKEQTQYNETFNILNEVVNEIYKQHLHIEENLLENIKNGYTFYCSPQEAKEIGLIDEIISVKDII